MNHQEQLILYAAGQLDGAALAEFEAHLAGCAGCQEDVALWAAVAEEISASEAALPAPAGLADSALGAIHRPARLVRAFHRTLQLLRAQAFIVHREILPTSAAVMALGTIVALLSKHLELVYFIAPMVAAASLSVLFGPENDPAYELTMATFTSPWKVLLARLSLISAYNLLLVLGTAAILLVFVPLDLLWLMIFGWLAPMAFLSALALLFSLWLGTSNGIAIAYILWIAQYIPYRSIGAWQVWPRWASAIASYYEFWHSPALLLLLSVPLLVIALWSAKHPAFRPLV